MTLTPRVAALLLVPPLMWAGNAVVGRMLADSVPPMRLNALRWAAALLILLPLAWRAFATAKHRALMREGWPHLLARGGLGLGAYNSLQYLALQTSSPINVTLIASSMPVWMLLVGLVRHGERPRRVQWLGAVVSTLGVLAVLLRGNTTQLSWLRVVSRELCTLLRALSWSIYSWMLVRPPPSMQGDARPDWNWAEFLAVQIAFGLLWSSAATGAEVALGAQAGAWTAWHWAALAFIAIGPSVLAYRCWGVGVAAAGPTPAAFFANLTPLFATLLAAMLLVEPPRLYHGVAFVLIVAGIAVSSRR